MRLVLREPFRLREVQIVLLANLTAQNAIILLIAPNAKTDMDSQVDLVLFVQQIVQTVLEDQVAPNVMEDTDFQQEHAVSVRLVEFRMDLNRVKTVLQGLTH